MALEQPSRSVDGVGVTVQVCIDGAGVTSLTVLTGLTFPARNVLHHCHPRRHSSHQTWHHCCLSRHLVCLSRHLVCLSRHLVSLSRHLACLSRHLACLSRHLACLSRHLVSLSRHLLCLSVTWRGTTASCADGLGPAVTWPDSARAGCRSRCAAAGRADRRRPAGRSHLSVSPVGPPRRTGRRPRKATRSWAGTLCHTPPAVYSWGTAGAL